jgi:alpha-glucosidase
VKLVVAESDVDDYPGLWLHGNSNNSLEATFPPVALKETAADRNKDRDIRVTEAADYIAVTKGTRTFPWRIIGVAASDGD